MHTTVSVCVTLGDVQTCAAQLSVLLVHAQEMAALTKSARPRPFLPQHASAPASGPDHAAVQKEVTLRPKPVGLKKTGEDPGFTDQNKAVEQQRAVTQAAEEADDVRRKRQEDAVHSKVAQDEEEQRQWQEQHREAMQEGEETNAVEEVGAGDGGDGGGGGGGSPVPAVGADFDMAGAEERVARLVEKWLLENTGTHSGK